MVAACRDALAVDAHVEGAWVAGGAVHHGGGQHVVGGGVVDAAEKLATVAAADCEINI